MKFGNFWEANICFGVKKLFHLLFWTTEKPKNLLLVFVALLWKIISFIINFQIVFQKDSTWLVFDGIMMVVRLLFSVKITSASAAYHCHHSNTNTNKKNTKTYEQMRRRMCWSQIANESYRGSTWLCRKYFWWVCDTLGTILTDHFHVICVFISVKLPGSISLHIWHSPFPWHQAAIITMFIELSYSSNLYIPTGSFLLSYVLILFNLLRILSINLEVIFKRNFNF